MGIVTNNLSFAYGKKKALSKVNLNLTNAQKGIYLMNVTNPEGKRYTKKLVIK